MSVLEQHSDKNKARQRGCDLGTAGGRDSGGENTCVEVKRTGGEGGGWLSLLGAFSVRAPLPTLSVCGKRRLLQTEVGPVDGKSLTSLSSRVQAEPEERS